MASLADVRRRVADLPPEAWTAVALSTALFVYGNTASAFPHEVRDRFLLWSNLGLMAVLLAWALGLARLTVRDLGLSPRPAAGSALLGAALSVVVAVPPVAFIGLTPLVTGDAIEVEGLSDRSGLGMAYFLAFRQPVGTALFEEVAFRGVLYGAWHRVGGGRGALLATATTFSLWHLVIANRTVAESGVVDHPALVAAGVLVVLAGLFVGGLCFALLRWHTGSIAAAVVAHWLIVAFMSITVWAVA